MRENIAAKRVDPNEFWLSSVLEVPLSHFFLLSIIDKKVKSIFSWCRYTTRKLELVRYAALLCVCSDSLGVAQ